MKARWALLNLLIVFCLGCSEDGEPASVREESNPNVTSGDSTAAEPQVVIAEDPIVVDVAQEPEPNEPPATLPDLAFQFLKTRDEAILAEIVMSPDDFVYVVRRDAKRIGLRLSDFEILAKAKKLSEKSTKSISESLESIDGWSRGWELDWSTAVLNRASVAREGTPYDPSSDAPTLNIRLHIQFGDKSITLQLDQCERLGDKRRIAGGFVMVVG